MRRSVMSLLVVILGACDGDEPDVTSNELQVTVSGSAVLTLAAIEGGAPLAIGVRLTLAPQDTIVVALAADPLVALDRTTLTFTAADYDRPQPVVITPADDADVVDEAGEIVLTATDVDSLVLPIAIADDDGATYAGVPDVVYVMEGGSTSFGLALAADPGGPITMTLASSDAALATVQPATLTFAANWSVAQTVTVTAPADADDLDEDLTLHLGGLHALATVVPVVVLDVDRQNFVISPAGLELIEGGSDGSLTVRLTQPPTGTLAIAVTPANPNIATVSSTTLTFTAADYAVPQSVTVSPRADRNGMDDASAVRLTSSGLRDRAVAITVAEDAIADLIDFTGDFLMTILPAFSDGPVLRYRVTYTVDPVAALLEYTSIALRVDDGSPVGDPMVSHSVELADDLRFEGLFDGLLPAEANPYSFTALELDAAKFGRIVDGDLLCGTLTGTAGALPLDGATWTEVRITGPSLPDPVVVCPAP